MTFYLITVAFCENVGATFFSTFCFKFQFCATTMTEMLFRTLTFDAEARFVAFLNWRKIPIFFFNENLNGYATSICLVCRCWFLI